LKKLGNFLGKAEARDEVGGGDVTYKKDGQLFSQAEARD
jgi:hypothetical protein